MDLDLNQSFGFIPKREHLSAFNSNEPNTLNLNFSENINENQFVSNSHEILGFDLSNPELMDFSSEDFRAIEEILNEL